MDLFVVMVTAYFALLGLGMVFRKKTLTLSGPWWFLLRAFFPNWQFFHGLGPAPRLWVRTQGPDGQWSDWRLHYPRKERHPLQWLHNPEVNLALSHQNLVEHLSSDIQDLPENGDIRSYASYRLVTRLARQAAMAHRPDPSPLASDHPADLRSFQFEVRLLFLPNPQASLLLQSPVLPWTA
ncbi:hypothetical protein [Limnohabitans sp.]|jgi:hypothetical protein|uniref:hypothetical protein n=1 Tax=Limnohabitans sp. TaxID=1907725 RepID=UPI0039BD27C5|nr:hypothetical protein [Comamonadaceae bacterium]